MNKLISLSGVGSNQVANFCGPLNANVKNIEGYFDLRLRFQDEHISLHSDHDIPNHAVNTIEHILEQSRNAVLTPEEMESVLRASGKQSRDELQRYAIRLRKKFITPKSDLQCAYVESIARKVINFGVGPAGTGKTYLAVAKAVEALENEDVARIILTRPAVEAGEKLGFLPGDLSQKVDPYLRPVYDALYEMLGFEKVEKLITRHVIEVAPLAYMRGRTLNNAFVILDEAQNTTPAQMKMFLTRIGFGSRAVITGDVTQTDLPGNENSGLKHSLRVLQRIDAVGFTHFTSEHVVRHPLVQSIVEAYDRFESGDSKQ